MKTLVTTPRDPLYEQRLTVIELYVNGAQIIEDCQTKAGSRLLFGLSRPGLYVIHVHGRGYHRLSVTDDRAEASRLVDTLKETYSTAC
jgi:hypothetical protein|nr:MAG TPA: hypothetical protein [Caudoviricetes sp.]